MSKLQLMIDEIEAKADEIEGELTAAERELSDLLMLGKALSIKIDAQKEKQSHLKIAANRLRSFLEDEAAELAPQTPDDPWG